MLRGAIPAASGVRDWGWGVGGGRTWGCALLRGGVALRRPPPFPPLRVHRVLSGPWDQSTLHATPGWRKT
eukprot:1980834-Prymnesium_polylepis.3